jgi:hypothetical protein
MIERLGFPHPGPLPEGALPKKDVLPKKGRGCPKIPIILCFLAEVPQGLGSC